MLRAKILALCICISMVGCTSKRELGNVLRVAVREKYKSLDPIHGSDYYSNVFIRRTYEGLLQYNYLKRPYEIEPLLAESMPSVSKDGLVYTFKIRQGVLFQDDKAFPNSKGRELEAQDFVYSLKRLADPTLRGEGWWTLDGKIAGLNDWREQAVKTGKADYATAVTGLQAPEKYTFVLKLTKPNPLILHVLTMNYASVVAREVVEHYGQEFVGHPVGTGPFRLDSISSNQLVWIKNPTYRTVLFEGKQIPFIDKLVDDIIIEDQPAWLNFLQGNHDYLMKIPKDNRTAVFEADRKPKKEFRDKNIQVFTEPGAWFNYTCFNMEDPVVGGEKNKFLRKAMALAYDEAVVIDKFYLGLATKAESPIPPGILGFDPNYKNPYREYNLSKAREILAKAGHPNGEGIAELVYDSPSDLTQRQIGEYFQRSMALLGIKVRLNTMSWSEMLNRIRKKQSQVWGISWLYDYPDAENGWQLLYGRNESPGSNEANYKNPKFDALYEKIATMPDGPVRREIFGKMREIFAEDVPWIITIHQMETRLAHPWVHNFKIHNFEHGIEKYLSIDILARKQALK